MKIELVGGPLDGRQGTPEDQENPPSTVFIERVVWDQPLNLFDPPKDLPLDKMVYVRRGDTLFYDWYGKAEQ